MSVFFCVQTEYGEIRSVIRNGEKYGPERPYRGVLRKRCSENMQQMYRRTPMPKCDFNKVAQNPRHECSPVNLLYIFRTPFSKTTSGRLILKHLITALETTADDYLSRNYIKDY